MSLNPRHQQTNQSDLANRFARLNCYYKMSINEFMTSVNKMINFDALSKSVTIHLVTNGYNITITQ
jgi:hypothetical protein